jgi:hypothetical protein
MNDGFRKAQANIVKVSPTKAVAYPSVRCIVAMVAPTTVVISPFHSLPAIP